MHKILLALVFSGLASNAVLASDETDVMATIHRYVASFNKGDVKGANLAICGDQVTVVDDIPPYEWQGADGCSKWLEDSNAYAKANGITNARLTLGKPRQVAVTANHAYVVVPATFSFDMNGKPMKESGAIWTLVLQKGGSGWRSIGSAWAGTIPAAVKTESSGH
jgi:ketosteroid isomerase-like protein